jgi:hypothetical protein
LKFEPDAVVPIFHEHTGGRDQPHARPCRPQELRPSIEGRGNVAVNVAP